MKTDYSDIKWAENDKLKLLIIVGTRDYPLGSCDQGLPDLFRLHPGAHGAKL